MYTMEEMNNWNYATAWDFFNKNAVRQYIPESQTYVQSLKIGKTIDIRDDSEAREKILQSLKSKSLILMDGSSLNGKSTFAKRLARMIEAEVVDIDMLCIEWLEKERQGKSRIEVLKIAYKLDELTDLYLLNNLENIVKEKSTKSVILVGAYLEVIYRSIIAKTLGKYFDQVVSLYCCAKRMRDLKFFMQKRDEQFRSATNPIMEMKIIEDYKYAKRLLASDGIALGIGMDASFIADISVINMFE